MSPQDRNSPLQCFELHVVNSTVGDDLRARQKCVYLIIACMYEREIYFSRLALAAHSLSTSKRIVFAQESVDAQFLRITIFLAKKKGFKCQKSYDLFYRCQNG